MACNGGAATVTARTSTKPLSKSVKQSYYGAMSPCDHLSTLTAVPRLLLSSQETLPMPIRDVLLPESPPHWTSSVPLPLVSDESKFDLTNYKMMSRSDEQLASPHRLVPSRLLNRQVRELPRSFSLADLDTGPKAREGKVPGPSLRRMPPSITNLRSLAQSQDEFLQVPEHLQTHVPLEKFHDRPCVASVHDEHTHIEKKLRRKFHYKSYTDLHILSMYQGNASASSLGSSQSELESTDRDIDVSTSPSDNGSGDGYFPTTPRTPTEENTLNATAVYAGGGHSQSAKARRTHARRVQVIEHREGTEKPNGDNEHEIIQMREAVLKAPGKPRLVQIHRPRPSDPFLEHTTLQNMQPQNPTTPRRGRLEVSRFSPYDTPASGTPFSDLSRTASEATPTPHNIPKLVVKTHFPMLRHMPSTPPPSHSSGSDITIFSTDKRRVKHLADPFGSPLSNGSSMLARSPSITHLTPPELPRYLSRDTRTNSGTFMPSQNRRKESHEAKLRNAISSTQNALDVLSRNEFHLDSPELISFRIRELNHRLDSIMLTSLTKVFPHAPRHSLSTLAAWVMVDQYFTHLFDTAPPADPSFINSHVLPGIDSHFDVSPSRTAIPTQGTWTPATNSTPQPRELNCHKMISSPLLHSGTIPSKAASLLGIHTDPAGCKSRPFGPTIAQQRRPSLADIGDQARNVHASVQEIGHKLVRDLIVLVSPPSSTTRQRSIRVPHMRGRSATSSGSPQGESLEAAVRGMWEACRCIASFGISERAGLI